MNGSPLFTGDAGSGESEIRRWILENDWLEALIALPEQLFYNTGIATYVWVLTNRKAPERKGLVQLIDATSFWTQMRKSLGDKRREIPPDKGRANPFDFSAASKKESSRQDLPNDTLRLPQDHGRASAQAEFPSQPRAHRPARRGIRFPKPRREQEEKCEGESQRRSGRQERAGSNPKNALLRCPARYSRIDPHSRAPWTRQ